MVSTTAAILASAQRTGGRLLARPGTSGRGPVGGAAHARPALLAILAMAALLFTWDIQHSGYHAFYAQTARSMSESWKGFLFGSFDPGNSITIDKLPGFLWPQALSARIFGFHPWALTLPQVIEGVLSVAVLYRAVRRWAGESAGLLAAGAFALTPAVAGLFRTQAEDPAFTLLVLLAADATLRAAREARLRPLLAAGMWVGLGFQAKMLEAWAVLPALGLLYAVSAPAVLRRRLAHLAAAGAVCLAVSASWVLLVTLTPAKDRPYVDGTTNNSAISQVVGYNFLTRFSSLGIDAKDTGSVAAQTMAGTAPAEPGHGHAATQWAKMVGPSLASQVGWLYPAAALAAVCGLVWLRGRPRTDPLRAGFLLWAVWLATYFLVFSAGAVGGHTYYMGVVAVPLAALFGAGTVQFWRAWRKGSGARTWALPVAVVTTVAWSAVVAGQYPTFLPWLAPAAIILGAGALALLALSRTDGAEGARRRIAVLGLGLAVAAMLGPSAAWAASVLDPAYGHSGMGSAGPVSTWHHHNARQRTFPAPPVARNAGGHAPGSTDGLDEDQQRLLAYTRAHQDGATYLFATTSWRSAAAYILYAGAKVLPMGGFTGAAPTPTGAQFRHLVATGRLRYVVLGGVVTAPGRTNADWVRAHCARVPFPTSRLYRCSPRSAAVLP
ncbi:ArnT family glycosyltransferase [Streptomyces sp. NPDC088253]|uniref:ArnT family glycosyltransferase n=1 Tax=Streptomyces sp. NPDC088253 TaxID=3365846 RepID=UPI00381CCF42